MVTAEQLRRHNQSISRMEKQHLKNEPGSTYIVNEDLDHGFTKNEVALFEELWQEGWPLVLIAEKFKRDPDELFLLLFDRVRKNKGKIVVNLDQIWRRGKQG